MLTLVMIVKDEAETIVETLDSVRGVVDAWYILDTGSTDGTPELIEGAMAGLPGSLERAPFVDFSTTRNRALRGADLMFPQTMTLMLSGTEVLVGGEKLKAAIKDDPLSAHHVTVHFGSLIYPHPRLCKPSAGYAYQGRTHEVLTGPGAIGPALEGCHIHYRGKPGGEDKTARWLKDLDLLGLDMLEHPDDPRAFYYCAQTLRCLGRRSEAYEAFIFRAAMGGYLDERYLALVNAGRLAGDDRAARHFELAIDLCPDRAEAFYELAMCHHNAGRTELAYLFARSAHEKPMQRDRLFVEREIYEWRAADLVATHAYSRGHMALGKSAAEKALRACPHDPRLQKNLSFYTAA